MERFFQEKFCYRPGIRVLLFVSFLLFASPAPGLPAESLEEGARREGKLMFHSVLTTKDTNTLTSAFQKKYPFIKVEFWHGSSSANFQRALREKQMGQSFADVLSMVGNYVNLYKKEGLMGRHISPEAKGIDPGFKDPDGFWTANYTAYFTFIYNTKMVAKKELPKTYEGLLDPRWKRKIGKSNDEVEWFMGMLDFMGEEKGKQFMRRLADQDPVLRSGRSLTANLMVAGEFPLALGIVHRTLEQQKEGAPVEMIPFPVPTLVAMRMIGIGANPPHPNAAKLFVDFTLSKEGQSTFNRMSRHPVRTDVPVEPAIEAIRRNLFPIKARDAEVVEGFKKEYDRIFKKR